jgi:hypothetical protein
MERSAVLCVEAPQDGRALCAPFLWGCYDTVQAEERFAHMLTEAALQAGMPMLYPWQARNALAEAGLGHNLKRQPPDAEECARALGCDSYIAVAIHDWGYSHVLFASRARLEFTISCFVTGASTPLWQVRARARRRGMTDLEIAPAVLAEVADHIARKSSNEPVVEAGR